MLIAQRATNGRPPTHCRETGGATRCQDVPDSEQPTRTERSAGTAGRMVKLPVDWQSIVGYYEANAPEQLARWLPGRGTTRDRPVPEASGLDWKPSTNQAVANVRLVDLDRDGRLEIVLSDLRNGIVYKANPRDERPTFVEIARPSWHALSPSISMAMGCSTCSRFGKSRRPITIAAR